MKRILLTALAAGAIAGAVMWGMQILKVVPLIQHAEQFERLAAAEHHHADRTDATASTTEEPDAWEPDEGLERAAYTLLTDLIVGVGFALLLVGGIALSGREITWRQGILWGIGGFAAFYGAPSLGLPPEVPGMQAADLVDRQIWWISTALATTAGLALVVFGKRAVFIGLGAGLILLPHLVGAPAHAPQSGLLPAEIAAQFTAASLIIVQLFWMLLGGLAGFFYDRFGRA